MAASPDIVLAGYGVRDTLQLTVEAQRAILRVGRVYVFCPPPNLRKYLESLRVQVIDLGASFAPGRSYRDAYLDVASVVLGRARDESPLVLLVQGNPLFLNAITRYVAAEATKSGLRLLALPGVSLVDALISELGLDVGTFGLQVFDARRIVERELALNPAIPVFVLQVAGLGSSAVSEGVVQDPALLVPLTSHLGRFYSPGHAITLLNPAVTAGAGMGHATVTVSRLVELAPHVTSLSALFIDAIRSP